MEKGNQYLEEYTRIHNQKYAVEPAEKEDGHRFCYENLKEILAIKEQRKVTKDLSIQYQNKHYLLETKTPNLLMNKKVDVIEI